MKTKNIFEDNPYYAMYKYNINFFNKLYKHTSTRMIKSVYKDESRDRDKKNANDIIPPDGHDICNHLTRYDVTSTRDNNNWQRKQI